MIIVHPQPRHPRLLHLLHALSGFIRHRLLHQEADWITAQRRCLPSIPAPDDVP